MLIPTRGKTIVENIPDIKQLPSGLFIAQNVREVPHKGRVISIGLQHRTVKGKELNWHFKIGEIVHYKRKWTNPRADLFILLRDDIFAVEGEDGLRSVRDMVIIKRHYKNTIAEGLILVPDSYGTKQNHGDFYGEVIAEGPESKFNFKRGDNIMYSRDEGMKFEFEGQEYFSIKPRAILAMAEV